ncbi:MAG: 16S rRNA (guanine(527)-N(7))-methyltransferase RsmG [Bryobacteraceae bacterium]
MTFEQILLDRLNGFVSITGAQASALRAYYELLVRWNARINLTAIRTMEEAVVRHYCESLFLGAKLDAPSGSTVFDLGSGAGFPGIPLAVLRSDCQVMLIESHKRKAVFLREAARAHSNITVIDQRVEDVNGRCDWLVSRAVRPADVLEQAKRLSRGVGLLVGETDLKDCLAASDIVWNDPVKLPWGEHTSVLMGNVSRGTLPSSST